MPKYIDGFVLPVPADQLEVYQRVASAVAAVYKEHGAIDYVEFVGDDLHREGTRAFPEMTKARDNESVVFGWIVYESREQRDEVNQKVETDPRMMDLIAPIMDPENPIFDGTRMAFAGFKPLVES